jgi:hypothetical protein
VNEKQEKLSSFPFVIGGLSFIPVIGVIFGLIAISWGLVTKKAGGKKLALIGGGGIFVTVILYSTLFYFGMVQRGGIYDDLRVKLSETTIVSLVQAIEFYKTQNGKYPDSLEVLQKSQPENSMVMVFDPTDVKIGGQPRYFFYELIDSDHYYLLGVGPDGKPFTPDDILPKIDLGADGNVGLMIKGL